MNHDTIIDDAVEEVPVLIAGAGTAGLTTAITLAEHGIRSLLVERRPEPSRLPRATGVTVRTMELLRGWGLERAVRDGAPDIEWLGWTCETLAAAAEGTPLPVGMPSREQIASISPAGAACVPQDHLEDVLLAHLDKLGVARLERGSAVTAVNAGRVGARARVRDVATGDSRVVAARYLVAADGVHSTVRRALGIATSGSDALAERIAVQFRAPLWDLLGEFRYVIYPIRHADARGTFIPAGRGDRWVYALEWDPQREHLASYTRERMLRRLRTGAGLPSLQPRIERIGAVSYLARMAERYRSGSAFLVGDAAHRMTPRGGTGMNTAFHDGFDLGWKLAWVLSGWAGPALLDTYETERRPVAEHNVALSAAIDVARPVAQELHADLGGRIQHVWLASGAGRRSTLDLLGRGLTLFTGPDSAPWEAVADAAGAPPPVTVRALEPIAAKALGIRNGGALLARPDGAPAGLWQHADGAAPALRAAVPA
jgi:2-polyprenyl-6-methoxyphenol hydroxylase-like FAD-dependent oxidoreductase